MNQIKLDYQTIMAAARDAGNRSMREAGRTSWNEQDFSASCAVSDRLFRAAGLAP